MEKIIYEHRYKKIGSFFLQKTKIIRLPSPLFVLLRHNKDDRMRQKSEDFHYSLLCGRIGFLEMLSCNCFVNYSFSCGGYEE